MKKVYLDNNLANYINKGECVSVKSMLSSLNLKISTQFLD